MKFNDRFEFPETLDLTEFIKQSEEHQGKKSDWKQGVLKMSEALSDMARLFGWKNLTAQTPTPKKATQDGGHRNDQEWK